MKMLTAVNTHLIKKSRLLLLRLVMVFMLILPACGVKRSIDDMINEIESTRQAIENESSAWRDELTGLANRLEGMESVIAADSKEILASTTNQVRELTTQTIDLTDAKAKDLVGQSTASVFCTADFVKDGAIEQLQYIIDDLKFWKQNKRHLDTKPPHHVCMINPNVLHLYPSENNWRIDTSNMSEANIVTVFGYNFWPENMPDLELQDANNKVRKVITADYITHYQINLDFSNVGFSDTEAGGKIVFRWPDKADPNTINLSSHSPAKIEFVGDAIFSPDSPTAGDTVTLTVTIKNVGDSQSGDFSVVWQPDPNIKFERSISVTSLQPKESKTISFQPYQYQKSDVFKTVVSVTNGDAILRLTLNVLEKINPIQRFEYVERVNTEQGMRACPPGFAVAGIHVDNSEVLCRRVMPVGEEEYVATVTDSGSLRSLMHACPLGTYVRGFHRDKDLLLCSWDSRRSNHSEWQQEFEDSKQVNYYHIQNGMHICPRDGNLTYMTGIHVDDNRFLCGIHYRTDAP